HDDSRQNLTCSSQRFAIADNKFGEWHAAGSTARSQLDFSIQGQQGRNTIRSRRGITKIASNCPAILDLDGTDLSRCALWGSETLPQRSLQNFGPSCPSLNSKVI